MDRKDSSLVAYDVHINTDLKVCRENIEHSYVYLAGIQVDDVLEPIKK